MKPDDRLARLLTSALFVDAVTPLDFRRVEDLTPEEHARAEAWRRWARRSAAFVSTTGKTKAEIVRDMARAMRKAGLLKP